MQTAPRRRRTQPQAQPLGPRIRLGRLCAILAVGALVGTSAGLLSARREGPDVAGPSAEVAATATAQALAAVAERKVVAEQPPEPTPDLEALADQRMREAVFGPFDGLPGRVGIAVRDLGSGRTVLLNEQASFEAASLYKLPVMYEVFRQRESGGLRFGEELTIGPEDAAFDLGTLFWPIGTRITVGTALERMIVISDNSSAVMLTQLVRAQRINESMLALGLSQTAVERDHLSTSALDMLGLLELLARGRAVNGPTSGEMVRLMARQEVRNRIPALLPSEVVVANKTGNWEGAIHDVGLIYGPRATLAVAFLSDEAGDSEVVYGAMARAARGLYDLANDPTFGTRADPPLPPLVGSYAAPPILPPPTLVRPPAAASRPEAGPSGEPTAVPTARGSLAGPLAPGTAAAQATARATPKPTRTPQPEATPTKREATPTRREATPSRREPTATPGPRR